MKKNKVIHFGAGNIGRGLVAYIYQQNNYEIYFVDTNLDIVNKLNLEKKYKINYFNQKKFNLIKNFKALHISETTEILKLINEMDIISTSIGAENLHHLKPLFQKANFKNNTKIICFENGFKISDKFKEILNLKNKNIDFINSVIDRIIPLSTKQNQILDVQSEKYFNVVLEQKNNFQLNKVQLTQNIDFFIIKKLIFVNAIHTTLGIVAAAKKYKYIHNAFKNKKIIFFIKNFIKAIISVFEKEFNANTKELQKYSNQNLKRFKTKEFNDLNIRLIRNLNSKFALNERFGIIFSLFQKYKIDNYYFKYIFENIYKIKNLNDEFFANFFKENNVTFFKEDIIKKFLVVFNRWWFGYLVRKRGSFFVEFKWIWK
ncbi:mannitol-1-phosphate 5-dehydrogenase [Mesomycoplasma neurolyticum]|uniref:Mannitol-1-phosphate 5-dehydrogenase n=1 Tax=Mesomycoplasma neurolyticum TaxID=2120 RepID=A0A449A5F0_9BACT|nr:mannitol-1-phosphate 5-dehydrogenase [Mesomycoplasma neurolyticum]VEU59491.1 Mannitol-1-phosphate 5-dehydrogenase [Mesomycoplasma neurolyticum]